MEFSLVPLGYKKLFNTLKLISFIVPLIAILLSIAMIFTGLIHDYITILLFSVPWLSVIVFSSIMGLKYDRVNQSTVTFESYSIQVRDKKGKCWREVPYNRITKSSIESISGFFFGKRRNEFISKYVCFYLTEKKEIPIASYKKLFCENDFFMMAHSKEAWETFIKMYSSYIDPREKM